MAKLILGGTPPTKEEARIELLQVYCPTLKSVVHIIWHDCYVGGWGWDGEEDWGDESGMHVYISVKCVCGETHEIIVRDDA